MKYRGLLLFSAITIILGLSGCSNGEKVDETVDFSSEEISIIKLNNDSWNVNILTSTDNDIHISYNGTINGDKDAIQVRQNDNELLVDLEDVDSQKSTQFSFGESGKITLYIPEKDSLSLKTENVEGDMEIENITCLDFSLNNDSGNVEIKKLYTQNAEFQSKSGDIKITDSNIDSNKIETSSAYITLNSVTGNNMDISTRSGEVNAKNIDANIDTNISTGSGDVSVAYKKQPDDLSIDVTSDSKDISIDMKSVEYTKNTESNKKGVIGNGTHNLSLRSDSGTIVVK